MRKGSNGWIALHRKITESEIWLDEDEKFCKRSAWIDLLLMVNHEERTIILNGKPVVVKPGQKFVSIRWLSGRWKWSKDRVYGFLTLLEDLGMCTKEIVNGRTLLTVTNWAVYQRFDDDRDNRSGHSSGQQSGQQSGHRSGRKVGQSSGQGPDADQDNNNNVNNDIDNEKQNIPPNPPQGGIIQGPGGRIYED